ncbi:unnamed protein product [Pieris macdunnoughi]|uniref:Uncharacterized protein n=1 Tax=Pieris macdunnoughi TaxID=345717 RepID=A0A821LYR6_9NEOP|nr:unnamed protein product [Pieris macdunnoughi]
MRSAKRTQTYWLAAVSAGGARAGRHWPAGARLRDAAPHHAAPILTSYFYICMQTLANIPTCTTLNYFHGFGEEVTLRSIYSLCKA